MQTFIEWLEAVAVQNQQRLSTGNGGGDAYNNDNDDGGDDDDDFESGPWGWKKMESLNLALHDWAKKSPAIQQIGQIVSKMLFEQPPFKEYVRVFPNHVQLEVEWELKMDEWSEFDNQIEAVLKRSDLYEPLGITQDKLWDTVDRGAVYDYMLYVIIMALTGRQNSRLSYLDNQASYYTWQYLKKNWTEKEQKIKKHIQEFHDENNLGQIEIQLQPGGRAFDKPMGISQSRNNTLWGKGVVSIAYTTVSQRPENPDVWDSWGEERPMNYRLGQQRNL
jgi:hypothetical protein